MVFLDPMRGVVGLVDELLTICNEHALSIRWHLTGIQVDVSKNSEHEIVDVSVRKSIFRAVLARLAALCNTTEPGSVSPHSGVGEIVVEGTPAVRYGLRFANTPDELRLDISLLSCKTAYQSGR